MLGKYISVRKYENVCYSCYALVILITAAAFSLI